MSSTESPAIEFRSVSKVFSGTVVLHDISLQVRAGERVVLFGPSGCGKTTLLRLIAGFLTPDTGEVAIGGRVVASGGRILCEPEQRNVGMVFQDLALWPHLTVEGNLTFGLKARKVARVERARRVKQVLELIGLPTALHKRPHELSGGEQQRIALARALVLQPQVLLMDEPLASLEEGRRATLSAEIVRLQHELSFTLVYVTHSRDEAQIIATRSVTLNSGTITAET